MAYQVLTPAQVEQFVECGWTRLEQAFPRACAVAARDFLWERLAQRGPHKHDVSTWTLPMVHIQESYTDPVFQACGTPRLADAIEDLVGRGRWATREKPAGWGWWPVNFAHGAGQPWDVPTGGWHWDGQHFRHYVDAPDQGLLLLCVFSDVGRHGGGTLVAEGSHAVVAEFLAGHPDGLELGEAIHQCVRTDPWLADLVGATPQPEGGRVSRFMDRTHTDSAGRPLRVVETTANAGDVFLCHPFLIHAASQNHSGVPRFMCNRTTPLRERMNLSRADGDHSPLEFSIRRALGRTG